MPFPHPENELLTTSALATVVGVVPDTVRVWKRAGKITPKFSTPGGQSLYTRAEAERIRDERVQRQGRR